MKAILYGHTGKQSREVRIDKSTRALTTIDYEHHEIHGASHYIVEDFVDVASGTSREFFFQTPDSDKEVHMTAEFDNEVEMEYLLVRGASALGYGTTIPSFNSNENSDKTAGLRILHTPGSVDTTTGVTIARQRRGSGKKLGGDVRNKHERIWKRNTWYYLRCHERSGTQSNLLNYIFTWYEHTEKD